MSIDKYLARYAEPEALLAERVLGKHELAIVLPVLGESASALSGLRGAVRELPGRALVILVVNASELAPLELRRANAALLDGFTRADQRELSPGVWSIVDPDFDLVVIDRSSPGRQLPPREGVGLARKIGCDFALSLLHRGSLSSPWIFWADADAALPRAHFEQARRALEAAGSWLPRGATAPGTAPKPAALCFPFRHVSGEGDEVTRATLLHEVCLRYHVLSLAAAGSPYAHHSLGSALAVDAGAYAVVRGVPKRRAGEDFYLLDKLAKVGSIARVRGEAVVIGARCSPRVPFGTGPRVERILREGRALVASPAAFRTLAMLLEGLDRVARERRAAALEQPLSALLPEERAAARHAIEVLALNRGVKAALETSGSDLSRRLHTWFDALRTLRALHLMRDAGLAEVPISRALVEGGFESDSDAEFDLERVLERLRAREAELFPLLGPALPRPSAPG